MDSVARSLLIFRVHPGSPRVKHLKNIMESCWNNELDDKKRFIPNDNSLLKQNIIKAKKDLVPENYIDRVLQFAKQGYKSIEFPTYNTDWDSEAYLTVSGQNSNNSVRINNDFLNAVLNEKDWNLIRRTDGKIHKRIKAKELWDKIGHAAWSCADPVFNMILLLMNGILVQTVAK